MIWGIIKKNTGTLSLLMGHNALLSLWAKERSSYVPRPTNFFLVDSLVEGVFIVTWNVLNLASQIYFLFFFIIESNDLKKGHPF